MGNDIGGRIIRAYEAGDRMYQAEQEKARLAEERKLKLDLLDDEKRRIKRQEQFEKFKMMQGTQGEMTPGVPGTPAQDLSIDLGGGNVQRLPGSSLPGEAIPPKELPHKAVEFEPGWSMTPPNRSEVQALGFQDFVRSIGMKNLEAEGGPQKFADSALGIYNQRTGKVETPAKPKAEAQPSIIQEYLFQVQEDIRGGKKPLTFDEYQTRDANRKRPVTNVNVGGTGLSQPLLTRVTTISNQFDSNPVIKNYNEQWNRAEGIKAILSRPWSGPGDMATVFEFMKALDPTSVVRESEYATAASTGNIFAGWAARFNGYLNPQGGFLSDQVKKDFLGVLDKRVAVSKGQAKRLHTDFSRRIDNVTGQKGTGEQFLTDYSTLYDAEGPVGDAPQKGATKKNSSGDTVTWDGSKWVLK